MADTSSAPVVLYLKVKDFDEDGEENEKEWEEVDEEEEWEEEEEEDELEKAEEGLPLLVGASPGWG